MNYLAHLFLSFQNEKLMVGNFIADSVKGKKVNNYEFEITKGIKLHRAIDSFTDNHSLIKESAIRLRPKFKKYSGVVTDIFYDHFLAVNFKVFSQQPLKEYSQYCYKTLQRYSGLFPEKEQNYFPWMVKNDWLTNYENFDMLHKVFSRMPTRTSLPKEPDFALEILRNNYEIYQMEFKIFFNEIILYSKKWILENKQ